MSLQQLLQQVLQSGQDLTRSAASEIEKKKSGSALGGFGGGALAGGALGLLLGNKKFRKMGGKVARYGGAAALGALALKTYQDWQSNKSVASSPSVSAPVPASVVATAQTATPAALGWGASQLEDHSRMILAAMVGAAKADGHIGPDERQLLESELVRLGATPADRSWLESEIHKPADPGYVAALATTPEAAAEVYLASVLVIDEDSFMERAYLDELARRLRLDSGLKEQLEHRVHALAG